MTKYIIAAALAFSAITCVDYIQPKKSRADTDCKTECRTDSGGNVRCRTRCR